MLTKYKSRDHKVAASVDKVYDVYLSKARITPSKYLMLLSHLPTYKLNDIRYIYTLEYSISVLNEKRYTYKYIKGKVCIYLNLCSSAFTTCSEE